MRAECVEANAFCTSAGSLTPGVMAMAGSLAGTFRREPTYDA